MPDSTTAIEICSLDAVEGTGCCRPVEYRWWPYGRGPDSDSGLICQSHAHDMPGDADLDLLPAPAYPQPGSIIPGQPGYVVGGCGHRVARSEWRAGLLNCERCGG